MNVYTDKYLIERLEWLCNELNRSPRLIDIEAYNVVPSYDTYQRRFGSLEEALAKIGMKPFQKNKYTRKEVLQNILEFGVEGGRFLTSKEMDSKNEVVSSTTALRHLGAHWRDKYKGEIE